MASSIQVMQSRKSAPTSSIIAQELAEWIAHEAVAYARKFAGSLRSRGVRISVEDQEDFGGAYQHGALDALRAGVTEKRDLDKAGRKQVYRLREQFKGWGERRAPLSEQTEDAVPVGARYEHASQPDLHEPGIRSLTTDPNAEIREIAQARVKEDCIEQFPEGVEKKILLAMRYGVEIDGRRRLLNDDHLAKHVGLDHAAFQRQADKACETLVDMMRKRIRHARPLSDQAFQ